MKTAKSILNSSTLSLFTKGMSTKQNNDTEKVLNLAIEQLVNKLEQVQQELEERLPL